MIRPCDRRSALTNNEDRQESTFCWQECWGELSPIDIIPIILFSSPFPKLQHIWQPTELPLPQVSSRNNKNCQALLGILTRKMPIIQLHEELLQTKPHQTRGHLIPSPTFVVLSGQLLPHVKRESRINHPCAINVIILVAYWSTRKGAEKDKGW